MILLKEKVSVLKIIRVFKDSVLPLLPKINKIPLKEMQDPDIVFPVQYLLHHICVSAHCLQKENCYEINKIPHLIMRKIKRIRLN